MKIKHKEYYLAHASRFASIEQENTPKQSISEQLVPAITLDNPAPALTPLPPPPSAIEIVPSPQAFPENLSSTLTPAPAEKLT